MADFDKVILPGKEGKIEVKIVGYKIHPGQFKKSFTVKTNDPENERVILYVSGVVTKVFDISADLNLNGFTDEKLEREALISSRIEEPINISSCSWAADNKDYEKLNEMIGLKLETVEKGKKYRVKVWNKKNLEPGTFLGDIVLKTDFKDLPEKKIMFRMTIAPDVQIHPNVVYMREMTIQEGTTKSFEKMVSIIATRGDSLKVLQAIPSSENIAVNIREVHPGKTYSCKIFIRPPTESGRYLESVKFITNYKGYEEIEMSIRGSVRVVGN
ncbi:MAG: hypothetical protein JXB45_04240 [Candidatus Krumholzibacteriota bacterium]|nr:hypothetical protein [Candidatus Krumholzibacteriota bacterium]